MQLSNLRSTVIYVYEMGRSSRSSLKKYFITFSKRILKRILYCFIWNCFHIYPWFRDFLIFHWIGHSVRSSLKKWFTHVFEVNFELFHIIFNLFRMETVSQSSFSSNRSTNNHFNHLANDNPVIISSFRCNNPLKIFRIIANLSCSPYTLHSMNLEGFEKYQFQWKNQ